MSCRKVGNKVLVGEVSSLGETIHALINTEKDSIVTNKLVQIVFCEDIGRNELEWDRDKLRSVKGSAKKKVDNIKIGKASVSVIIVSVRDHRMEKSTNGEKVSSGGRNLTGIIYAIATDGTADTTSDLGGGRVEFLLGFWVIIRDVLESIRGTVGT